MIIELEPLPFIKQYLFLLNQRLKSQGHSLSLIQMTWLGFCLMGILLTNSICWSKFEKMSLRNYGKGAIRWMFSHSKICWNRLLSTSD